MSERLMEEKDIVPGQRFYTPDGDRAHIEGCAKQRSPVSIMVYRGEIDRISRADLLLCEIDQSHTHAEYTKLEEENARLREQSQRFETLITADLQAALDRAVAAEEECKRLREELAGSEMIARAWKSGFEEACVHRDEVKQQLSTRNETDEMEHRLAYELMLPAFLMSCFDYQLGYAKDGQWYDANAALLDPRTEPVLNQLVAMNLLERDPERPELVRVKEKI